MDNLIIVTIVVSCILTVIIILFIQFSINNISRQIMDIDTKLEDITERLNRRLNN